MNKLRQVCSTLNVGEIKPVGVLRQLFLGELKFVRELKAINVLKSVGE